ncbi:MAG: hypothetical protein JWR61_2688 [Ferruginibacter sp.]|nr:hypothetical protein [Ferruginibacter sp.]
MVLANCGYENRVAFSSAVSLARKLKLKRENRVQEGDATMIHIAS